MIKRLLFILATLTGAVFTGENELGKGDREANNTLNELITKQVFDIDFQTENKHDVLLTKLTSWMKRPFIIVLQKRKSSLYEIDLENVKLKDELTIPAHSGADFIETIELYEDMWIIQGSRDSHILMVTKAILVHLHPKVLKTLLIPFSGLVIEVYPFKIHLHSYIAVIFKDKTSDTSVSIFCLSCEESAILVKAVASLMNPKMDGVVINDKLHFVIANATNEISYTFDPSSEEISILARYKTGIEEFIMVKTSEKAYIIELGKGKNPTIKLLNGTAITSQNIGKFPEVDFSVKINDRIFGIVGKESMYLYRLSDNRDVNEIWSYDVKCHPSWFGSAAFGNSILLSINCNSQKWKFLLLDNKFEKSNNQLYDFLQSDMSTGAQDQLEALLAIEYQLRDNRHDIMQVENNIETEQLVLETTHFHDFDDETDFESTYNHNTNNGIDDRLSSLRKEVLGIYEELQRVITKIPNMLSYSGSQRITSDIIVNTLRAKEVKMFKANISKIKGTPIDVYKDEYLNVESDQTVVGNFSFSTLTSSNATVKTITDGKITIRPEDFMLTNSPKQEVTGNHVYSSVFISEGSINSPRNQYGYINGISVSDLVLKNSNVAFMDEKIFGNTFNVINHLHVNKNLNKVPYEEWKEKLMPVTRKTKLLLHEPVVIRGNLTVDGNVNALAVNGIDIPALSQQSARETMRPLVINGPLKFADSLHIDNLLLDNVNGFDWNDVLRTKDSSVKAVLNLNDALVLGDVVGPVNDIDFNTDVLLTERNQTIEGETTFLSDVGVFGLEGVTMDDGAKINDIDPSEDAASMMKHRIIYQKDVPIEPIEIDGDVQIDVLNNLHTADLGNKFWTRTSSQKIQEEIVIPEAEFRQSINAHTLNGRKIDNYFLSDYQQIISGGNIFMANVSMDNLEVGSGVTIDGVDVSVFKNYVINLHEQQVLNRNLDLKKVYVENLTVGNGLLGTFNLSRAVHSSNPMHSGRIVFSEPVTVDILNGDGSLNVMTVNGKRPNEYFGNRQHSISVINGSLTVDRLNTSDITVDGELNKRNITAWFKNALFKDESSFFIKNAHVKGKVFFEGNVNVKRVNGKLWKEFAQQLSQVCPNCFISGTKKFTRPIDFIGNLNFDLINGINITRLVDRLLLQSKSQKITGKYTFIGDVTAGKTTTRVISGIPIDKILLVNSPGTLKGTTKFANFVKFNQIFAPHSWMNGCNLDEALTKPIFDQIYDFESNKSFAHIHIKGNLTSNGQIISRSGKNHISILTNLVQKSKDQVITGNVTIHSRSSVNKLRTKLLNDRQAEYFVSKQSEETSQDINCDLTLANGLKVEYLRALEILDSGDLKINNHSIKELDLNAIPINSTDKITGTKYFRKYLRVQGDLMTKRVNDVPHNKFLTAHSRISNQTITFNEAVVSNKLIDLSHESLPDSVAKIAKDAYGLPNNTDTIVNLQIKGNLLVDFLNGINLTDLVTKDGRPQEISGKKRFQHLIIDGEALVKQINGISTNALLSKNSWPFKRKKSNIEDVESSKLPRLKSTIEALNTDNENLSKRLHTKLVDVSGGEFVAMAGVEKIEDFRITTHKRGILAITRNPDHCKDCSCYYQTHILKVRNGRFIEDLYPFNGIYFVLNSDDFTGELFDFVAGCDTKPIITQLRKVTFEVGKPTIILHEEPMDIGLTMKGKEFRVDGTVYIIVLSYVGDDLQLKVLTLSSSYHTVIQKFDGHIMDFDYMEIDGQNHLIVISESNSSSVEDKILTESSHYVWNKFSQKFEQKFTYLDESATSVKLVTNGEDTLLIFGEICYKHCYINDRPGKIKIYKKTKTDFFQPYFALSVGEITSLENFVIDTQLYIAVTLASNVLQLYEFRGEEGMRKIQDITVKSPTDSSYLRDGENHYLSIATNNEGILLIKLHIAGVDRYLQ